MENLVYCCGAFDYCWAMWKSTLFGSSLLSINTFLLMKAACVGAGCLSVYVSAESYRVRHLFPADSSSSAVLMSCVGLMVALNGARRQV